MTVPSMPMRSELARFMPAIAPVAPRQMLPPPTTTASSSPPRSMALAISEARKSTVEASIVSSLAAEARASPDSFRTTRRTRAYPPMTTWANAVIVRAAQELGDGLLLVLDVVLLDQHAVLEPAVDSSLDDLGQRRFGLALVARDLFDRGALGVDLGLRARPRESGTSGLVKATCTAIS